MQVEDLSFLIIHGCRYLIILEKNSPRFCHVEEFTYLSVAKKRVCHRLMTHPPNLKVLMKNTKSSFKNGLSILSHTTCNAQRGGKCRKNADGDLKNGLPSVCFHLTHFDSILKVKLKFFVCFTGG